MYGNVNVDRGRGRDARGVGDVGFVDDVGTPFSALPANNINKKQVVLTRRHEDHEGVLIRPANFVVFVPSCELSVSMPH